MENQSFLQQFFKLKEKGTSSKTEIIAGITTFFTMVYIVFVNPSVLGDAGMDKQVVFHLFNRRLRYDCHGVIQ